MLPYLSHIYSGPKTHCENPKDTDGNRILRCGDGHASRNTYIGSSFRPQCFKLSVAKSYSLLRGMLALILEKIDSFIDLEVVMQVLVTGGSILMTVSRFLFIKQKGRGQLV